MIYPMFAMVLLTIIVGLVAFVTRVNSVKQRQVSIKYFRTMSGQDEVPARLTQSTRSFNNQFEVPVLFYVVCTLFVSLNIDSQLALVLAWAFVASRAAHAYVHVTYNNIIHRMYAYWVGVIVLLLMWVTLLISAP